MDTGKTSYQSKYYRAKWRMLLATMFCYLFYYTGRQNWGWAVKALIDELGFSAQMTGIIAGAMLGAYGIGQLINGNLGDKYGGRRLMNLGAILSCVMCWITSFGGSFFSILIPWTVNGYVQSLGWAPGSRLISNWWGHNERARAFGFYMFAAGFSAVLTYALCILILQSDMSWRWLFRLPVLLLLAGGTVFYFVVRDKPEELGFEPVRDNINISAEIGVNENSIQRYAHAFTNWRFLVACIVIGFQSMARYGLLFWVPLYYLGDGWKQDPAGVWITLAMPVGMALGAVTAGQLSDRLFHSVRSRPVILFLTCAAVITLAIYFIPREQRFMGMAFLFLAGFFVYGAQAPLWALCPDLLGIKRAGTGVGIMDAFAYGAAALVQPLFGRVIDTTGNVGLVFVVIAVVCGIGAVCMMFVSR